MGTMNAIKRPSQVLDKGGVRTFYRRGSGDQDIIYRFAGPERQHILHHRLQASAGTVTGHRIANLLARGKADARVRSRALGLDHSSLQN
jgi:hypothetical protein